MSQAGSWRHSALFLVLLSLCLTSYSYEGFWQDPVGDVTAELPAAYAGEEAALDLLSLSVEAFAANTSTTLFSFTMAEAAVGLQPLLHCYIATSPLGSWRVQKTGSNDPLSNPSVQLSPLFSWDVMLEIDPSRQVARLPDGTRILDLAMEMDGPVLRVELPHAVLGEPEERWTFVVLVGALDSSAATAGSGVRRFMEVDVVAQLDTLGGGEDGDWDPNVVDVLLPDAALSQQVLFGKYCATTGHRVEVSPVGLTVPPVVPGRGGARRPVAPGGNACPASASTNVTSRYKVTGIEKNATTARISLRKVADGLPEYGSDAEVLVATIDASHPSMLHLRIDDASQPRWRPLAAFEETTIADGAGQGIAQYEWEVAEDRFGFRLTRKSSGEVLFDTIGEDPASAVPDIVFKDRYVALTTLLPHTADIYGLGERVGEMRLRKDRTYATFNLDQGTPFAKNIYGSHPFYLDLRREAGHGVLMLNSHGMDVDLGQDRLTYRMQGGPIDLWFFLGPSAEEVVQQYQEVIGTPALPPLWALGSHQCRWGYDSVAALEEVVAGYAEYDLPLETLWSDIDYMDNKKLFTLDPVAYPEDDFAVFLDGLHADGQHYVIIVDPGVRVESAYAVYEEGMRRDIFVMDAAGEAPALGKVWPGPVHFVDFLNEEASSFWREQVAAFRERLAFDGLWIDMNEIANFCDGHCVMHVDDVADWETLFDCPCSVVSYEDADFPPYWVGGMPPGTSTISMAARHAGDVMEEEVHNLYGHLESIASAAALQELTNERSLVITRASFVGTGHHAGHWLGDNTSTWDDLRYSIAGMLSMNLFGIPLTGADICGFNGNTTAELCARWYQLGAWYPFCRNHNVIGAMSQEPYALGPTVAKVARDALLRRYRLIPAMYTMFLDVHEEGGTVVRPLFFLYPKDPLCRGLEDQFLMGSAIMVAPVVEEAALERAVYFPTGRWYNLWEGTTVSNSTVGEVVVFTDVGIEDTFAFLRGGQILAVQEAGMTLAEQSFNPFGLLIALSQEHNATGHLYLDDGVSLDGGRSAWTFSAEAHVAGHAYGKAEIVQEEELYAVAGTVVWNSVSVYGVDEECDLAVVQDGTFEYYFWPGSGLEYDGKGKLLRVTGMNVSLSQPHVTITWGKEAEPPSWRWRLTVIGVATTGVVLLLTCIALVWSACLRFVCTEAACRRRTGSSSAMFEEGTAIEMEEMTGEEEEKVPENEPL